MRIYVIHFCMTQKEPGWELFHTFLEVARDGSLSGAARKLALTQPTVGRHIDALEAALGLSLFSRSPRGLTATPAALELVGHAEAMAAASAALRRTASSGARTDRGTVRITASEMIGCEVLPPMLASFRESHPGIVLELALSNRNEDLLRRDADIAVRMVRPRQKSLLARRIGKTPIGFYAHRDYLKRYGIPKSIAELEKHCLIGFDQDARSLQSLGPAAAGGYPRPFWFSLRQRSCIIRGVASGGGNWRLSALHRPAFQGAGAGARQGDPIRTGGLDRDARRHEINHPGPDVV
jgi:DNA-binding transcriptional LysR family regulator